MKTKNIHLETMTLNELAEHIISKMDIELQLEIVGDEYYYTFTSLNEVQRKDIILSALTQMPEDIIENII